MSNILLILFPTQLFPTQYIDKILNYTENNIKIKNTHIILLEHPYFFTKFLYNKNKLVLHRATMNNYFDLIEKKHKKKYIGYDELELLDKYYKLNAIDQIRFFNPIEKELINIINTNKLTYSVEKLLFPTPYFLNSTNFNINKTINNELSSLRHDLFYKSQRIKYNIMVKKSEDKYIPEGFKWSFDTENRKPFEKTEIEPKILNFSSKKREEYLQEAIKYIETNFSNNYGQININQFIYPINRKESIEWLEYFIKTKLDKFGKYEDALSSKIKFGYHSVLSPLTNIGLITSQDIIKYIIQYKKNIASKEGFIRQLIGWREYCYFTYDLYSNYLKSNSLYKSNRKIPKNIWKCSTQIPPIDNILKNVTSNGYSHHIERLMGIGNFLILIEINPEEIYNWFQTMYIDAYDVFMIPNIYGMLCFGKLNDSAHMMTRPYFCSSNYLMKMSDYKSSISVNINNKNYKWNEIIDGLYWSHVSKYSKEFKKIYATSSAVSRLNNFNSDKKKELFKLANLYKNWIWNN